MGLWDNIEQNNQNDHIEEIDNQDFTNEIYRKSLIKNLVDYSVDNNITDELCENLSINLQSIPKDKKEKILEIFTKNSKLLNSNNSYLSNPIKGMRLISSIINTKDMKEKNELELLFDRFDDFLNDDFIKFSSQISIPNEAKLYKELINIRNELFEDIKFSELINKTHIGIGGSFSAGKSSFLNSILDRDINSEDILPTDTNPTTSIPTYIVKQRDSKSINSNINIYTFNKNGKKSKIDRESLLAISHEFDKIYNFGLISIIEKIVIDIKDMPYKNIAFLDTPGYSKFDGVEEIDKNIALNHLQNINSLIWLIDIDNGVIRDGDIKFIQSLNFKGDILFVINKADKKPPNDIKKILESVRNTLKKANIDFVDIVAYSSHDKKEYFSKKVIDNFLKQRNRLQIINFELKINKILIEYKNYIENIKQNSSDILKILNQIDLYSQDTIKSVDNFDELLNQTRKELNKNKKDLINFYKIKKDIINITKQIDNYFNKNISYKEKIEKQNIIEIEEITQTKNIKISDKDCLEHIKIYTKAIELNNEKYLNKKNNKISKFISKIAINLSLNISPKNEEYFFKRANCYKQLNQYEDAIRDYNKVIQLSPDIAEYYENRVECFIKLKEYQDVILDYSKLIEIDKNYKKWYIERAKYLMIVNNYEDAIKDYSTLIKLNPKDINFYKLRANSYKNLKQYEKAIIDYNKVLDIDSNNIDIFYPKAFCLHKVKKSKKAIKYLQKIAHLNTKNADFFCLMAKCYKDLNQIDKAYNNHIKAIELDIKDDDCYYKFCIFYKNEVSQKIVLKYISQAIKLNPNNEIYYIFRIMIIKEDDILPDINKLIQLNYNNPIYYAIRAEYYANNNNIKAVNDIDKAMSMSISIDVIKSYYLFIEEDFIEYEEEIKYIQNFDDIANLTDNIKEQFIKQKNNIYEQFAHELKNRPLNKLKGLFGYE